MLGRPLAGVAPASSSSSPSTTTTSRRSRSSAWAAADASRLSHVPTRAPATVGDTARYWSERLELLDHGIEECVAVGLASQAACDEERNDVHPGRGMGDEPRRQRGLAGPRPGLPPGVGIGTGAELGPLG